MHQILLYLLRCSKALVPEEEIANMLQWEELEWQKYAEECKGMIVTSPGMVEQIHNFLFFEQSSDMYMSSFREFVTGLIRTGKGDQWHLQIAIGTFYCLVPTLNCTLCCCTKGCIFRYVLFQGAC